MKKTCRCTALFIIVCYCIFNSFRTNGQTGWQWGIGSTIDTNGFESLATAIDKSGNVFEASVVYSGSGIAHFGTIIIDSVSTGSMVITKTDSSGNYLWALVAHSTNILYANNGVDMVTDSFGNVYLLGIYSTPMLIIGMDTLTNPSLEYMYFMVKLSSLGNVLWSENITGGDSSYYFTHAGFHATCNLGIDGANNIYLCGNFLRPTTIIGTTTLINTDSNTEDVFIAKFDNTGNSIWAKSFGGLGDDWCTGMAVTDSGNIYVVGQYYSPMTVGTNVLNGSINYICKYDSSGICVWAKNISRHAFVNAITTDQSQNIFVAGNIDSSIVMGPDTLTFAGHSHSVYFGSGSGTGDAFLAKYSSSGNILWGRSAGGDSNDVAWNIVVDTCQNVWVCGTMGESYAAYTMNFNGHILTNSTPSLDRMFIATYDNSGNYIASMSLSIGGDDWCGLTVDNRGNFYIAGDYVYIYNPTAVIFGTDTLSFNTGFELPFLAKYKYGSGDCNIVLPLATVKIIITNTYSISIYPNPATKELTISASDKITTVAISNLVGQTVYNHQYNASQIQVDVADLPKGIYFIKVNGSEVRKFVKE